jgi:hypothetical protein
VRPSREAFAQFLAAKKAAVSSHDPVVALRQGWDDYVRFAADRPQLYGVMMSRLLRGAQIPAAEQAYALLLQRVQAIAAESRLAVTTGAAADLAWASANAASMLHVTAALRSSARPEPTVIEAIREGAMRAIVTSTSKGERQ